MPRLAQLVAASPLEAAIHDAYGKVLGQNSYNLLGPSSSNTTWPHYLDAEFAGEYLDRYTLRQPKPRMPLYHLVGALDPLTTADVATAGRRRPAGDAGRVDRRRRPDASEDQAQRRRPGVGRRARGRRRARRGRGASTHAAARRGTTRSTSTRSARTSSTCSTSWRSSSEQSPAAFDRVQYIEQPTHRDLKAHPENRMHAAAKIKPVVIDESLVDLESLLLGRELGYTGVALKACKGQTEALLMGAAAQKYGMFLCVQDLTCPGASFLHSASLAARIPTVAAIEGNGRQYCPAGNRGWAERYPSDVPHHRRHAWHRRAGWAGAGVLTSESRGQCSRPRLAVEKDAERTRWRSLSIPAMRATDFLQALAIAYNDFVNRISMPPERYPDK